MYVVILSIVMHLLPKVTRVPAGRSVILSWNSANDSTACQQSKTVSVAKIGLALTTLQYISRTAFLHKTRVFVGSSCKSPASVC
jgi:hypothetical protein